MTSYCNYSIFTVLMLLFQDLNFWTKSWLIAVHSYIIDTWSLSEFSGFVLSICLLIVDHKFSMGWTSEEFPGHGPKIFMFCSLNRRSSIMLENALISTNLRTLWFLFLIMAVFFSKVYGRAHWEETPTREQSEDSSLLAGMIFSEQAFFQIP